MSIKRMLMTLIILVPSLSFGFFCPGNFQQINFGDTVDLVKQKCGEPAKEESEEVKPAVPQEWNYFVKQTVGDRGLTPTQGTLKTQFAFDASGRAINISVNGIGVGGTDICGKPIKLGDSREKIKSACGDPVLITEQTRQGATAEKNIKTKLFYESTPPQTLIFENGILKSAE